MAYIDRHLVNVNTLLNAKVGDRNVESLVEDADHGRRSDDGAVLARELGDEHAEVEVLRLLLSKLGRFLLDVALLGDLGDRLGVDVELDVDRRQKDGFKLAVDHDIGVSTDRAAAKGQRASLAQQEG